MNSNTHRFLRLSALAAITFSFFLPDIVYASGQRLSVGWVVTEKYARMENRPALYWPGNMLDGKDSSAWCLDGGPRGVRRQRVRIGFTGNVEVDRVGITTGNASSQSSFEQNNRVTRLTITDEHYRRRIDIEDKREQQVIQLHPPVRGQYVEITIDNIAGENELTCISGIVFFDRKRPLNGTWLESNIKYDALRSPVAGVWVSDPLGAPEKFLTLFVNGTYLFSYTPHHSPEKSYDRTGPYRITEDSLRFQVSGQWHTIKYKRLSGHDDIGEPYLRMELSGAESEISDMEGNWHGWLHFSPRHLPAPPRD